MTGYHDRQICCAAGKMDTQPHLALWWGKPNKETVSHLYYRIHKTFRKNQDYHSWVLLYSLGWECDFTLVIFLWGDLKLKSDFAPPSITSLITLGPLIDRNGQFLHTQSMQLYLLAFFLSSPTKSIPIKGLISGNTRGVIYLLSCPCGKSLVAKTTRELKQW